MKLILHFSFITICFICFKSDQMQLSHYNRADLYCQSIRLEFETIANDYQLEYTHVVPIVFPECIRYNAFANQIETTALEYLYVNLGPNGADFSIGQFQMKPSFIEQLEQDISKSNLNHALKIKFQYPNLGEKDIRAIRVYRLNSITWQMHYICAFYSILNQKFKTTQNLNLTDQIGLYAAAYNYGYQHDIEDIKAWENQTKYVFDPNEQPQAYANIAKDYFLKLTHYE